MPISSAKIRQLHHNKDYHLHLLHLVLKESKVFIQTITRSNAWKKVLSIKIKTTQSDFTKMLT